MKKLRLLIVEDEPYVRADLCYLLKDHPAVEISNEVESVKEAVTALNERSFDAVFLDIQIRGGSGFDVLDAVPIDMPIVFFTSHEEYAVKAFEVDALDYLVKPVSRERLFQTVERLITLKALEKSAKISDREHGLEDSVVVNTNEKRICLPVNDIVAINSIGGNYTSVHTITESLQSLTVRKTFKEWQYALPSPPFERIHRQAIANMRYVTSLDRKENGSCSLYLAGLKNPLDVSRRCLPLIKAYLERNAGDGI